MFAPKATQGEREFKNEIMVWDPYFDSKVGKEGKEKKRHSDLQRGHVWMSFDPAETNVGFRQERRFKGEVVGEKSIRFSIYNDIYEFLPSTKTKFFFPDGLPNVTKIPNYAFLDEALCDVCKRNASWVTVENVFYCGTHSTVKKHPNRQKVLHGRKKADYLNDDGKWKDMYEYANIVKFLETLDFSEVRYIVLERQMSINYRSTRVAQHLISTLFSILRANKDKNPYFPIIYEIDPKIKSRVYGVRLPRKDLKKWTLRKAIYNAVSRGETSFLELVVKNPEELMKLYESGELTEMRLWDLVEPERNTVVAKEKAKLKKDECILTRKGEDLYDICDAKEQIESLIIELGLKDTLYFSPLSTPSKENKEGGKDNKGEGKEKYPII